MRQIRSRAPLPVPTPRQVLDRRIIGTPAEVAAKVALARDSGRLVAITEPRQIGDGRVWVELRVVDRPVPVPVPTVRRRRWPIVATLAGLTGAALAALLWAIAHLVAANAPAIAGGLGLLVLVLAVLFGRGHRCTGLHCSGCKG
jgi:hypothetical protein